MEAFRQKADENGLVPHDDEPTCLNCYYFLSCANLAADPPTPMKQWPANAGVCNLGQRKPFTTSAGLPLYLVKEGDPACYEYEQGHGQTKSGMIRL
jgi:hypothetical protein